MTEHVVADSLWRHVRSGAAPTPDLLQDVARSDAAALGAGHVARLADHLHADVFGAGPLEPLMSDPCVTDVLVNGAGPVWVDRGHGLQPTTVAIETAASARRLATRLATLAGRRLDDTSPYVDGLLPGGVRLHAVLPPLVEGGAHISLRIPQRNRLALDALGLGSETESILGELVLARTAFIISGGTGSGKTTLLAAMLGLVASNERVVVVEDVRELQIAHPHVVRLEARSPNVEGVGEIALVALVRQSLRMRPDRVVVGEVRGAEVRELLAALNTGHEGGCGTVHANTSADVVARFEALGALGGMNRAAVRSQLVSAVQVVIHVRKVDGARVVTEIGVLVGSEDTVVVVPALRRDGGRLVRDAGWPQLARTIGHPQ